MKIFGAQDSKAQQAQQRATTLLFRGLALAGVAVVFLWGYAAMQFNGLRHPEAMDQAQVGRNLAAGGGFTTRFVRPLSIWRLVEQSTARNAMLEHHPDLINPPAYPAIASLLFHIASKGSLQPPAEAGSDAAKPHNGLKSLVARGVLLLFDWPFVWGGLGLLWLLIEAQQAWFGRVPAGTLPWHATGILMCVAMLALSSMPAIPFKVDPEINFTTFGPDSCLVYGLGLPLTLLNGVFIYLIGRRLFDRRVGTVAALLFIVSETTCQYAISGLSTMLTMAWVNLATLALVVVAEWRESDRKPRFLVTLALVAAALIGGAFLTKYAAGWLLLPACVLCWYWWGSMRGMLVATGMALVFLIVTGPWLARNHAESRSFLGLAQYSLLERTSVTPGDSLQRTLDPKILKATTPRVLRKAASTAYQVCTNSPWAGGAWLSVAAFIAAICYRFRRPQANQLKWFAAGNVLLWFTVICAVGIEPPPEGSVAQAGNLLMYALPLMAVFAAAMICIWLDMLQNSAPFHRHAAIVILAVTAVMPTALRTTALPAGRMQPPYYPPTLAQISGIIDPQELMVSDQPWAVAWYGDRCCAWLPYTIDQLYKINDLHKHVSAMLLTPVTLNNRLLTDVMAGEWRPWSPVLGFMEFPKDFPLRSGRLFVGPDLTPVSWKLFEVMKIKDLYGGINMFLLCDRKRWTDTPAR